MEENSSKKDKIVRMPPLEINAEPEVNISYVQCSTRRLKNKIKELRDVCQGMEI